MSTLEVPGAKLFYEWEGQGPLLVLVHGANGSGDIYTAMSKFLARKFTVVRYDRRGFSRSELTGEQDFSQRLKTDAEDLNLLIQSFGRGPAFVFGSSSGGIVVLEFIKRHSASIKALMVHEPPAITLLPDYEQWRQFFNGLYDLYKTQGVGPAMKEFAEKTVPPAEQYGMAHAMDAGNGAYAAANAKYWFEHEVRQYPEAKIDIEALKARAKEVALLGGKDSGDSIANRPNHVIAEQLGKGVVLVAGGHVGYVVHPLPFAREVAKILGETI